MSYANRAPLRLLTINTGSSSLKTALYEMGGVEKRTLAISVERIGHAVGRMHVRSPCG